MFKLESKRLKREFKITNGNFYASQILNKVTDMCFVPDGNGSEFTVFFEDGSEFSSKGLPVLFSNEENEKLKFVFAEYCGVTVTVEYWVHADGCTVCKQLTLSQNDDKVIDRVFLEDVGIINSVTNFGIDPKTHGEGEDFVCSLGQPFYIDSLFFACPNPAVDSKIIHGSGQIRYYIGKNVGKDFKCPVTVMGGGSDNTLQAMQDAFFEHLRFISRKNGVCCRYLNNGSSKKADAEALAVQFSGAKEALSPLPLDGMVEITDVWESGKSEFPSFGKHFENGFAAIREACGETKFGIRLNAAGDKKQAKKLQKTKKGYVHSSGKEICMASPLYTESLTAFLRAFITENKIEMLELDFGSSEAQPCTDTEHGHAVGGKNDMYYLTAATENRMALLKELSEAFPALHITLRGMKNLSPFWRQWVDALDNAALSDGEGEAVTEEMPVLEAEMTKSDTVFYDTMCTHALQLPADALTVSPAAFEMSEDEFLKYTMWRAVRGEGTWDYTAGTLALSDKRKAVLAEALRLKNENQRILKDCRLIGGRPADGNIYGFVAWTETEGVVAMRNPTNEKTSLTLTLNKLMGVPENFENAKRNNIYSLSVPQTEELYAYGSKIDLTLHGYECVIFKFKKETV